MNGRLTSTSGLLKTLIETACNENEQSQTASLKSLLYQAINMQAEKRDGCRHEAMKIIVIRRQSLAQMHFSDKK
jgi:hypothetical protein